VAACSSRATDTFNSKIKRFANLQIEFSRREGDEGADDYDVYTVSANCKQLSDGSIIPEHFEISTSEGILMLVFLLEG
jgi:hypothetical protein